MLIRRRDLVSAAASLAAVAAVTPANALAMGSRWARAASDVQAAFNDAKVDATVRADHVRISFALFNNTADVDRVLAITNKLA